MLAINEKIYLIFYTIKVTTNLYSKIKIASIILSKKGTKECIKNYSQDLCHFVRSILPINYRNKSSENLNSALCLNKKKIRDYFKQENVRFNSFRFKDHFCQANDLVGLVGNWAQCGNHAHKIKFIF